MFAHSGDGSVSPAARHVTPAGLTGGLLAETNGGVTIGGFPTVASAAEFITVDAGLVCSVATNDPYQTPPVSSFPLTINIPGHDSIDIQVFILRPPIVGIGAFTIPALPVTIVYAPPQGRQAKNSVNYSDTESLTRTVQTTVSTNTQTKSMQAYSAEDIIGKLAGAVGATLAVVGTGGGAAGGASVLGAMEMLGEALVGKAKEDVGVISETAKEIQSRLSLLSTIVTGFDGSPKTTDGESITTQQDQSVSLSVSTMAAFGAQAMFGPGVGDRIVYMKDVKCLWSAVNGEVAICVLGFAGPGANSAHDLLAEQRSLAAQNPPQLDLSPGTIRDLLRLDPLVRTEAIEGIEVGPALGPSPIVPPRFLPADPPGHSGSGTSSDGDVWAVTVDTIEDTKDTTVSSQTTITDDKPGWLDVMFGDDNVETVTTTVLTMSQSTDVKAESKLTLTIKLFSVDETDSYNIKCFHDRLFDGYVLLDHNSPLLQGLVSEEPAVPVMAH